MIRALLVALLLACGTDPLPAQSEAAPVGYWSLTTPARDAEGRPLQVAVIVRFREDGTFQAVLKTHDGSGEIGSSGPFWGRWEWRTAFGGEVLCVARQDLTVVVCPYTLVDGVLVHANRRLSRHTADQMRAIAPELVGP